MEQDCTENIWPRDEEYPIKYITIPFNVAKHRRQKLTWEINRKLNYE